MRVCNQPPNTEYDYQKNVTCNHVGYNKIVTGGNDPSISKAMQYSQYIKNSKPKTIYNSTAAQSLAAQGITYNPYFSPILVSLQFTNLKQFNLPRLQVFSKSIRIRANAN